MWRRPLDLGQLFGGDFKPLQQLGRRGQRLTALHAELANDPLGQRANEAPRELVPGNTQIEQLLDGIERVGRLQTHDDELLVVGQLRELDSHFLVDQVARDNRAGIFEQRSLERR